MNTRTTLISDLEAIALHTELRARSFIWINDEMLRGAHVPETPQFLRKARGSCSTTNELLAYLRYREEHGNDHTTVSPS